MNLSPWPQSVSHLRAPLAVLLEGGISLEPVGSYPPRHVPFSLREHSPSQA